VSVLFSVVTDWILVAWLLLTLSSKCANKAVACSFRAVLLAAIIFVVVSFNLFSHRLIALLDRWQTSSQLLSVPQCQLLSHLLLLQFLDQSFEVPSLRVARSENRGNLLPFWSVSLPRGRLLGLDAIPAVLNQADVYGSSIEDHLADVLNYFLIPTVLAGGPVWRVRVGWFVPSMLRGTQSASVRSPVRAFWSFLSHDAFFKVTVYDTFIRWFLTTICIPSRSWRVVIVNFKHINLLRRDWCVATRV